MDSLFDEFGVESPVYAGIRFLIFLGITALLGALSTRHLVVSRLRNSTKYDSPLLDAIEPQLQRWIRGALVLLVLATGMRLAAQHAAFFGLVAWSRETISPLLLQTSWGHGWLLAVVSLVCASVGQAVSKSGKPIGRALLVAGALGFTWSMAMSGHPAAAEWPYLAMSIDLLHVIGAGGWIGTLLVIVVVLIPLTIARPQEPIGHDQIARLVATFNPIAMVCAPLVVVTGVIAGWRELGSIPALFSSDYGFRLLWKVGGVTVVGLLGAYNWRKITPKLGEAKGTSRLRKSAGAELVLSGIVLAITSVLVATSPP